ncbi:MAG: glutathione S-transferase family protein [Myxococcales bacterium]|nr:glutathione S-transferase family protein [Myxococcales bacterium]
MDAAGADPALIFHHYDFSNFSEKIRLIFGRKALAWRSVTIPSTAPKPDYEPLTGGYRRTPALQIGADVYCDTRLIAAILEERVPEPTLFPGDSVRSRALAETLAMWAESQFLWPLALYITGVHADRFPASFHEDRALLHGKPVPDHARVRASAARNRAQLEPQLGWLEALVGSEDFLLGAEPGLVDFTVYHPLFLLEVIGGERPPALLAERPRTRAWMERVASVGNGRPTPLTPGEALRAAAEAEPRDAAATVRENPEGHVAGDLVSVAPIDDRSSASAGVLVALSEERIAIELQGSALGNVRVHFPRVGYRVRSASGQ